MTKSEIRKVGIVGEGKMGTNLFYYLLDFGFELRWLCSRDAPLEKINRTFQKKISRALETGIIDRRRFASLQETTVIGNSMHLLIDCDLVIEAITEDLPAKKSLLAELQDVVPGTCIIASNSSSIVPSLLSDSSEIRKRLIGLHFFYPIALKNMVEFIITDETFTEVIAGIRNFLTVIQREYLFLPEKDGFILNKIFLDFQNEAFLITSEEKLEFSQVDCLIKNHLFPTGAFDFCDSVGTDIMLRSVENYTSGYENKEHYRRFLNTLERLVNENRLGIKSGSGFYDYPLDMQDAETILSGMDPLLSHKIIVRLRQAIIFSIGRFSLESGISKETLRKAMSDYLDSDSVFK